MKKLALAVFFLVLGGTLLLADQPSSTSPQIDISGFKKWEHREASVDPNSNYFAGLTQLGGYTPTYSGGPWQERLQLRIIGQLSENLSVSYDLDQQPETPERFDVKVKYYNNELTFGDINASFAGNEFVSTTKSLNGVMLTAKDTWYDIITVPSAKERSQTQPLTAQNGNNIAGPYNLGHGSIIEGSEQIQLNGVSLKRNTDYTIDYYEGKVTFTRLLNSTDEFKYTYEFTNVLDLFFPTLSTRNFFGFQSRFTIDPEQFGKPAPKEEPVVVAARETFPTAGSAEGESLEGEASGQYQLKHRPLVNFSETLTFMGTQLKKNDDYIIRYDTGEIKLLTRFLPSSEEALTVDYRYPQISQEGETILGIGSRGPYRTKYANLVPGSERVEVDGKLYVRGLDYALKPASGELMFGTVIGPTSQIKIAYSYNVTAFPDVAPPKFPKELKLGTTYLKESAKKSANALTASIVEPYTGQSLISSNYLINLKNRPILPSSEAVLAVTLRQGGATTTLVPGSDYVVPTVALDPGTGYYTVTPAVPLGYVTDRSDPSDGYNTGTIYFLNHSIGATDEVNISYTYRKSIVDKYSGTGNGSKGPYFLRNARQIVPGSETVQVWEQGSSSITNYTRNASFDATAGNTGYSFNYNSNNPSITFNEPLGPTKNFQVIFQYVADTHATNNDISQVAYGFDGSFKIGDVFKIDSSYARSETDQVYSSQTTIESFAGNGGSAYSLHAPGTIVDNSETIMVNGRVVNRDTDYFITYTAPGSFNFFYIKPAAQDQIQAQYTYQDTSGLSSETHTKVDTAFRLGAETRLFGDALVVNGQTKNIGFDFSPLGSTAIGVGSSYNEYNVNFNPGFQSFFTNYSHKFNQTPLGASRQTFLRTYDNSLAAGINPGGLAQVNFNYRTLFSLDDPLTAGAPHNSDNLQTSYSGSLAPLDWQRGPLVFSQKYDFSQTINQTHVVNVNDPARSKQVINYYHLGHGLKFTERVGLGSDFQYSEPVTTGSLETETAHTRAIDNAYNLSFDLTAGFLQKWTARVSLLNHTDYTLAPVPAPPLETKNETYHTDITPFTILTGSLDHNRQERTSYVIGGTNPLNQTTSGNARLTPFSWFSIGVNASRNENVPETGADNKTYGRVLGGDADYTPISISFLRLSSHFAVSDQKQLAPLGTEKVTTLTNTLSQTYTLNFSLIPILPLTFSYNQEDYKNNNNSVTQPVTTETSNNTSSASFSLIIPRLPQLSLSGDYTQKITEDRRLKESRPKYLINGHAGYQVLTWGALLYDYSNETNKGEVQAGAVANLDYAKTTHSVGLNITVPVDNPVLKNFVFSVAWKQVGYTDNLNTANNFTARLFSFDGTMNF
ncbi:MAG: hypothetical protein JW873_03195 [Candidatus Saganbacteria bacterium]|nr:hypothetical protein [Candidatus Saganbacteria bacterium]